MQIHNVIQV